MLHTGYINTVLINKCGKCKNYKPLVKVDSRTKIMTEYCRGKCILKNAYKQRTDPKCSKFKEKIESEVK